MISAQPITGVKVLAAAPSGQILRNRPFSCTSEFGSMAWANRPKGRQLGRSGGFARRRRMLEFRQVCPGGDTICGEKGLNCPTNPKPRATVGNVELKGRTAQRSYDEAWTIPVG